MKIRRMYDVYNVSTLAKAAKSNLMKSPDDAKKGENINHIESTIVGKYNEDDYVLSPDKFSPMGWKYI
jgi:hypothetical protein